MKKTLALVVILIGLLIFSYPQSINGKINGSPGAKTNSPMDGANCTGCHSGVINSGQGNINITSNIPPSGYTPFSTYIITVEMTHPNLTKFGFEITSEDSGSKKGNFTITNSNETKLVNSDFGVTHKSGGVNGSQSSNGEYIKSWDFEWTAPGFSSSTGSVTFYASGVAANNNAANSGDDVYTKEYITNEFIPSTAINNNPSHASSSIFYFNNKLHIPYNTEIIELLIYDIQGKLITSCHSDIPIYINTSNIPTGTYIINTKDHLNKKYSRKINVY